MMELAVKQAEASTKRRVMAAAVASALPTRRTKSGLFVREARVAEMHGRDRNKACPCNSGRKWKRCHGRPS